MAHYLPSDITNKALRDTYYRVQNLLAERYESDLAKAIDKNGKRAIVENFKRELRDTINYYVRLSHEA